MNSPVVAAGSIVVHQGYLFKTPPLDKFFMSWKKRYFELTLVNPLDPASLDLSYYTDADKKEKRGSINLQEIRAINPVYNKTKGNIFSVETEDRKFLLKSADEQGKALWVAKLLEGCSKESTSFHVTIPNQPVAPQAEAVLKVSTPTKISVISSLNGNLILSVPFKSLRRIGCQIALDKDILWFETCTCSQDSENFYFLVVNSGIDRAYQIVLEYKRSIELALRDHMIMEESNQSKFSYSFVVKTHYGHPEFPKSAREQIISNGLLSLSGSGDAMSLSDLNRLARSRPSIGVIEVNGGAGPVPGLLEGGDRRSPSPYNARRSPPISPLSLSNGATTTALDKVSRTSRHTGRYPSSSSAGFDSGVGMDSVDESRTSAPCNLSNSMNATPGSWREQKQRKTTLDDMRKAASLDENGKFGVATSGSRKSSLAELQKYGGVNSIPRKSHTKGDFGIGRSSDSSATRGVSLAAYDHLQKKVEDISLQRTSPYSSRKLSSPAYIES